jgi:hypothetical protein
MAMSWVIKPRRGRADHILGALLFVKALNSYQAAMVLVSRGMSVESQTISRTVLECAIHLAAVAKDAAHVDRLLAAHKRHQRLHSQKLLQLQEERGLNLDAAIKSALQANSKLDGEEGQSLSLELIAMEVGLDALYQGYYRSQHVFRHQRFSSRCLDLPRTDGNLRLGGGVCMERYRGPVIGVSGGEGGIRTRGGLLTLTRFPGVRLKPLIHLSCECAIVPAASAAVAQATRALRACWGLASIDSSRFTSAGLTMWKSNPACTERDLLSASP